MTGFGSLVDAMAEMQAAEEIKPRRRGHSAAWKEKRRAWIAEHAAEAPQPAPRYRRQAAPSPGRVIVAVEPTPPGWPPERAAWDAYIAAREHAGQDHAAVVALDKQWGSRSQAIGTGPGAAERWAELAEWFEAWGAWIRGTTGDIS
jgi:hypothetical protein